MQTTEQELKRQKLTQTPIPPLVVRLAVPSVISMLITAVYNMVDAMFVGRISTEATASVGIVFSYMALVQAIAFFFGQGSANYMSRALGAGDSKAAKNMAACGFYSAIIVGGTLAAVCFCFMTPILRMLGALPDLMEDSRAYFFFVLVATPCTAGSFALNNQLRLQGNAKLGMIGMAAGAVLNIVLDPILIFGCGMGVWGASLATCLSQAASFAILLRMTKRRDSIAVEWKNFHPSIAQYMEIAGAGLPSLGRQGLSAIAAMVLNNYAGPFGAAAVAAFAVVNRLVLFGSSVIYGIGQGFQPVCGFNYGAQLYNRVKEAFRFTVILTTICAAVFALICFIWAPPIVSAFRPDDPVVTRIGAETLRYQAAVFPLMGWTTVVSMMLQNLRRTWSATFLAIARQGIFFIPFVAVGASYFGLRGVEIAQPLADACTFGVSIVSGVGQLRILDRLHRDQSEASAQCSGQSTEV